MVTVRSARSAASRRCVSCHNLYSNFLCWREGTRSPPTEPIVPRAGKSYSRAPKRKTVSLEAVAEREGAVGLHIRVARDDALRAERERSGGERERATESVPARASQRASALGYFARDRVALARSCRGRARRSSRRGEGDKRCIRCRQAHAATDHCRGVIPRVLESRRRIVP